MNQFSPPRPMLVKCLNGKFQMMNVSWYLRAPTDVALLDSFFSMLGEPVVTVAASEPHVREHEWVRERISDHLINALYLNNTQIDWQRPLYLFLFCKDLGHWCMLFIYLKAAGPNPISHNKLHDIILARKSVLPNIRLNDVCKTIKTIVIQWQTLN